MSTPINDGGPAFPCPVEFDPNGQLVSHGGHGMSLRDWFAGQALASSFAEAVKLIPLRLSAKEYAESMYEIADAMIAVRNTNTNNQ